MKKILYIAPHLSTGGLPQYLFKKIELLKDEFEIHVIEYNNSTGGRFIIQLDRIKNLIGGRLYTLGEDKSEVLKIIDNIKPDIIHLEEIPEYFMKYEVAKKLYNTNRDYFLVETSHDSSMNTDNKLFLPDKFMFVSNWQIKQYHNIDNVPKILVEYPIEYKERLDRDKTLKELGLDPSKKHILHVGLFTPRKNQKEFFEYAQNLPDYEFHCLGNQADNFKFYWEPLMEEKPNNLTWWDERKDVERFYRSMDLFLFTSRGSANDKETMPLVIREAISFKIPLAIYNLDVYLNYFDKFKEVTYLDFTDTKKNITIIENILAEKPNQKTPKTKKIIQSEEEAFIISTYPISDSITKITKKCILSIKKKLPNKKIILTSHIPIPNELQEIVDYCVIDNNNILTKHTYYTNSYGYRDNYNYHINLTGENNDVYHGPTCYTNYYNGTALANQLGFKKVYFLNYDYVLKNIDYIEHISSKLNTSDAFFGKRKALEGMNLYTYFLGINPNFFLNTIPKIENAKQYDELMHKYGSESNGLENIFYHIFKNEKNIILENEKEWEEKIENTFIHEDFSRCEYFTILPSNLPNYFSPLVQITNKTETKLIKYTVEKNGEEIINRSLNVEGKFVFWDLIKYKLSDKFVINFDIFDSKNKSFIENYTFNLDKDYFENKINNNGKFEWTGDKQQYLTPPYKIKIQHLLSNPEDEREKRSIDSISKLKNYKGIEYTQIINKPYTKPPPLDTCNRPDDIQMEPGHYKLTPGHYGCFKAHTDAILSCPKDDNTIYLFFECDALLLIDIDKFIDKLREAIDISYKKDYTFFSFAHNYEIFNEYENHIDAGMFTDAHAYLIIGNKIDKVHNTINNTKWDAFDLWVTNNFRQEPKGFYKEPLVFQAKGYSLIDKKISETNIKGDKKIA